MTDEIENIGASGSFVEGREDIPVLREEIERLKLELKKKDKKIEQREFQLERHIEVENNRRGEFKVLNGLFKEYEVPEGGKNGTYGIATRLQILIDTVTDCIEIQEEEKEEKEESEAKLLKIFNKVLEIIPLDYVELNYKFFPEKDKQSLLLELEKECPELGLSQITEDGRQGVSVLSLFATITDIFCNKRLSFELDKENNLTNVAYYHFDDEGNWVICEIKDK